jgi:hypothetical protein
MALDRMLDSISFPPPFALLISFMLPFTLPVPFGFLFFFNFYPRYFIFHRCGIDDLSEFNFPFLILCRALIKNKERKKKREPRRYYSSRRTSFDTFQVPRRA